MKNYVQDGRIVTVTVSGGASSGELVKVGDGLCGVAVRDIASGAAGELLVEGVVTLTASKAIAVGKHVYWSSGGKVTDAAGTTGVGVALTASGKDGDAIQVKLVALTKAGS